MATKRMVGRPPGVDGDQTREHIIRVARACFASHGYASTTNRMIADQAGLTTAAVYHHFGKKHELLRAVSDATDTFVYERMRAAVDEAATFVAKVQAVIGVAHQVLREDPEMATFAAAVRSDISRDPDLRSAVDHSAFTRLFADITAFGVENGEIAAADARAVQGLITALTLGLAFLASEVRTKTHGEATDAASRLLDGKLLRRPRK